MYGRSASESPYLFMKAAYTSRSPKMASTASGMCSFQCWLSSTTCAKKVFRRY